MTNRKTNEPNSRGPANKRLEQAVMRTKFGGADYAEGL